MKTTALILSLFTASLLPALSAESKLPGARPVIETPNSSPDGKWNVYLSFPLGTLGHPPHS